MTDERIEKIRGYLLDLDCPFTKAEANALCDLALKAQRAEVGALVPSAEAIKTAQAYVDRHYEWDIPSFEEVDIAMREFLRCYMNNGE